MPADVIAFANRLLPYLAVGLEPATSVRTAAGGLQVLTAEAPVPAAAAEAVAALAEEGSIGVISADADVPAVAAALVRLGARHAVLGADDASDDAEDPDDRADEPRITVVPATLAKGLEFDQVVVAEPAAIVGGRAARAAPALRGADPRGQPARGRARPSAPQRARGLSRRLGAALGGSG